MILRFSLPIGLVAATVIGHAISHTPLVTQADREGNSLKSTVHRGLPTDPTRFVTIEATEGTLLGFDISPDGQTLVFALLGDIYTMPVSGGKATQLTFGLQWDSDPVWSPDGRRIAYGSDGARAETEGTEWRVVSPNGKHDRLVRRFSKPEPYSWGGFSGSPEWGPDHTTLATGDTLVPVAGGPLRRSGFPVGTRLSRFSPDGRYAYLSRPDGEILRFDVAAKSVESITKLSAYPDRPVISPDGRWLVYLKSEGATQGLRVRNLETAEERWLLPSLGEGPTDRYVFTPDSRSVIVARDGKPLRIDVATGKTTVVPFSVRARVAVAPRNHPRLRLTNDSLITLRYLRWPTVSPDRRTVVFVGLRRLYTRPLPSAQPRRLVAEEIDQFHPAFSPDGRWVAYVTWSDTAGGHVWRVPTEGGPPERLTTNPGYYERPTWTPDGKTIAVVRSTPENSRALAGGLTGQLVFLPSEGGDPRTVLDSVVTERPFTFTDGGRILYQQSAGESAFQDSGRLVSTSLDGGDRRVLAETGCPTSPSHNPAEIVPSPDQRWVAYRCGVDLLVAPLEVGAGPLRLGPGRGRTIRLTPGLDPSWSADGTQLVWISGPELYRIDIERAMTEAFRVGTDTLAASAPPRRVRPHEVVPLVVKAPRQLSRGTLVLRGARVITMRKNEVIEQATVVINNDRIRAVGPTSSIPVPPGATVIDVTGKTIIPGLIDMHAHIGGADAHGFFQRRSTFIADLAYGITTAREVNGVPMQFESGERIEVGDLPGPRLVGAWQGISANNSRIESLDDARIIVQYFQRMGAGLIKQYSQPTRQRRRWVLQAASEVGLPVTTEPSQSDAVDGFQGMEHTPWAWTRDDMLQLLAATRTSIDPTPLGFPNDFARDAAWARDPKLIRFTGRTVGNPSKDSLVVLPMAIRAAAALRRGAHVVAGSHGGAVEMHAALWHLALGGFTPHQVLRAATSSGAEALGLERDLGSIEVGKIADLVILDQNPLEDIRNTIAIQSVMRNGMLYDGSSLDLLWPIKRKAPGWAYHPSLAR